MEFYDGRLPSFPDLNGSGFPVLAEELDIQVRHADCPILY